MRPILKNSLPVLETLCKKHKVQRLYAVGSVLTKRFKPASDIDFLVAFEEMPVLDFGDNFFSLSHELEGLFKRRVDLIVEKDLKNPVLIQELQKTRHLVYENPHPKTAA